MILPMGLVMYVRCRKCVFAWRNQHQSPKPTSCISPAKGAIFVERERERDMHFGIIEERNLCN
jgi:hypothetical protein